MSGMFIREETRSAGILEFNLFRYDCSNSTNIGNFANFHIILEILAIFHSRATPGREYKRIYKIRISAAAFKQLRSVTALLRQSTARPLSRIYLHGTRRQAARRWNIRCIHFKFISLHRQKDGKKMMRLAQASAAYNGEGKSPGYIWIAAARERHVALSVSARARCKNTKEQKR